MGREETTQANFDLNQDWPKDPFKKKRTIQPRGHEESFAEREKYG